MNREDFMQEFQVNEERMERVDQSMRLLIAAGLPVTLDDLAQAIRFRRLPLPAPAPQPTRKRWYIGAVVGGIMAMCICLFMFVALADRMPDPVPAEPTAVVLLDTPTPEATPTEGVVFAPTATIELVATEVAMVEPTPFPTWTTEPALLTGEWRNMPGFTQLERTDLADGQQRHMGFSLDDLVLLEIIGPLDAPVSMSLLFDIPDTREDSDRVADHIVSFVKAALPQHAVEAEQWLVENIGKSVDQKSRVVYGDLALEVEVKSGFGVGFIIVSPK